MGYRRKEGVGQGVSLIGCAGNLEAPTEKCVTSARGRGAGCTRLWEHREAQTGWAHGR